MLLISSTATVVGVCLAAIFAWQWMLPDSYEKWPAQPDPVHTMKAIIYEKHGNAEQVLQYVDNIPRPIIKSNQILVRVIASSINPCDFKFRRNHFTSVFIPKPKIPGADIAGVVVNIGKDVRNFHIGDRVAAMMPILGSRWGAAAEYAAINEEWAATIGSNTTFEQAASIPLVSLTALDAFYKISQQKQLKGNKILIQAGAGGVGSFAVQYAKNVLGMYVVCTASTSKLGLLKQLGADRVIDYTKERFEDVAEAYDVVLDPMSWLYERRTFQSNILKGNGDYLNIVSSDWQFTGVEKANGLVTALNFIQSKLKNILGSGFFPNYHIVAVQPNGKQLQDVLDLVNNSTIVPVVDRLIPLKEAEIGHLYLEQGRATGKVILLHNDTDQMQA